MKQSGLAAIAITLSTLVMGTPALGGDVVPQTIGVTDERPGDVEPARNPSVSANGNLVVFETRAALVEADTNEDSDIYLYNRGTDSLRRITKGLGGVPADDDSGSPVISGDGKKIAFDSAATNLVSNDTNERSDIFVVSTSGGKFTRVSVNSNEKQGKNDSYAPSISRTGMVIAFESYAKNLVSDDTNGAEDVFVRYLGTGKTKRVSVKSNGNQANSNSYFAAVDPKGLMVSFTSNATNLVANDGNGTSDVFVRYNGKTTRASVASGGGEADSYSEDSAITSKCRKVGGKSVCEAIVVFMSGSTNLAGDDNVAEDVFVRAGGKTRLISVDSEEDQEDFRVSREPSISSNGRYVAFTSQAMLAPPDDDSEDDVFVRDRQSGTTTQISVGQFGDANGDAQAPAMSGSGKWVAFQSIATNIYGHPVVPNLTFDIFLRGPLF